MLADRICAKIEFQPETLVENNKLLAQYVPQRGGKMNHIAEHLQAAL